MAMDIQGKTPAALNNPGDGESPSMPPPEDNEALLQTLTADLKRIKMQKARPTGGIESRVLLNLGFVNGEQYINYQNKGLYAEPQEPNKLYLMFNLIQPRVNKIIGRLSATGQAYKAQPDKMDPQALEEAEVVDKLIKALDKKLKQPSKTWELLWWMVVGGTGFEYTPWIPNETIEALPVMDDAGQPQFKNLQTGEIVSQQVHDQMVAAGVPPEMYDIYEEVQLTGDVGSEILGPLNVFIDQSVRSVDDLGPDQWVHIARIRTSGWIKENFHMDITPDKDITIVSTQFHQQGSSTGGIFLKDLIPLVQGSVDENDPPMNVVVESFLPNSETNPKGKYVCWVPNKAILHAAENPYEEIPLTDFHWKPVTTTFWTHDYVTDLIPPQRFINKRISQLGEQANATIYSQLLLGGSMTEKDIPTDYPGVIKNGLAENGQQLVQRLSPPEMPQWFLESINSTVQMFNDISGGGDLFNQGGSSGFSQMRGPLAVPMLQEILDTEWGPIYEHIGERTAKVKQMRLNRVKQFYPPLRTMHYTDRNLKDEVMTFHTDKVLRSGTNYAVTIERGSLIPELRALREARIKERLSGPLAILYMDERTGQLDKSKIAADLQFGDTGRESRESQYRKLSLEIIDMLWKGMQPPPVLPFYDHATMMDELEASMATTEFLRASPPIQQLFTQRWEQHRFFASQAAQQQAAMMNSGMIQNAVAQATQQAAAQAAAETVHEAMHAVGAAKTTNPSAQQLVTAAVNQTNGNQTQPNPSQPQAQGQAPSGPRRPSGPAHPGNQAQRRPPQR